MNPLNGKYNKNVTEDQSSRKLGSHCVLMFNLDIPYQINLSAVFAISRLCKYPPTPYNQQKNLLSEQTLQHFSAIFWAQSVSISFLFFIKKAS